MTDKPTTSERITAIQALYNIRMLKIKNNPEEIKKLKKWFKEEKAIILNEEGESEQ